MERSPHVMLIGQGADVLTHHTDSTAVVATAEESLDSLAGAALSMLWGGRAAFARGDANREHRGAGSARPLVLPPGG